MVQSIQFMRVGRQLFNQFSLSWWDGNGLINTVDEDGFQWFNQFSLSWWDGNGLINTVDEGGAAIVQSIQFIMVGWQWFNHSRLFRVTHFTQKYLLVIASLSLTRVHCIICNVHILKHVIIILYYMF